MATEIATISTTTLQILQQNFQELRVRASSLPVEVLKLNTPQLCQLGKLPNGEMIGVTVFDLQITGIVTFLGATWSPEQCSECARLAYDECYWFSLAELKQFTLRVKSAKYSSHKNFNPAVFMGFLQDYADEMFEARGEYYGMAKPVPKPVDGTGMIDAGEMFRQFTQFLTEGGTWQPIDGEPVHLAKGIKSQMDEQEYQHIRAGFITKQMQDKVKSGDIKPTGHED